MDQVTVADIHELRAHGGAYEGLTLEFKRELPGREGCADPWLTSGVIEPRAVFSAQADKVTG